MKREEPFRAPRQSLASDLLQGSSVPGRPAPRLLLIAELEELPRATIEAETYEDELRLLGWLARPVVRRRLLDVLDDVLAEIREAA